MRDVCYLYHKDIKGEKCPFRRDEQCTCNVIFRRDDRKSCAVAASVRKQALSQALNDYSLSPAAIYITMEKRAINYIIRRLEHAIHISLGSSSWPRPHPRASHYPSVRDWGIPCSTPSRKRFYAQQELILDIFT